MKRILKALLPIKNDFLQNNVNERPDLLDFIFLFEVIII